MNWADQRRTFLSWLHFAVVLGGLAVGLLNFGDKVGLTSTEEGSIDVRLERSLLLCIPSLVRLDWVRLCNTDISYGRHALCFVSVSNESEGDPIENGCTL